MEVRHPELARVADFVRQLDLERASHKEVLLVRRPCLLQLAWLLQDPWVGEVDPVHEGGGQVQPPQVELPPVLAGADLHEPAHVGGRGYHGCDLHLPHPGPPCAVGGGATWWKTNNTTL